MGVKNKVLELDQLPPETFSPDAYRDKPQKVLEFTEYILNSSGLVVVTPVQWQYERGLKTFY